MIVPGPYISCPAGNELFPSQTKNTASVFLSDLNDFVSAGLTASDEVACEKNQTDLKEAPQGELK